MRRIQYALTGAAMLLFVGMASAQVPRNSTLYITLKTQDSVFFERSFNRCDQLYLEQAIHTDLVFYHDQGGIQSRQVFLDNVRKNICGDSLHKPIRSVDPESLEVYPLYANGVLYGAIQHGTHRFYIREKNKPDRLTSTAKFTHVYLLDKDRWLLKEVLSYDHRPAE